MFNFQLPLIRGTELFPKEIQAPTAVRTYVYTSEKVSIENRQELELLAEEIVKEYSAEILNFYRGQRQMYDLGVAEYQKTARRYGDGSITMNLAISQGHEIVNMAIYPEAIAKKKEEDLPCLMVVYEQDKIAMFPMTQLKTKKFAAVYKYKSPYPFVYSYPPTAGTSKIGMKQFKPSTTVGSVIVGFDAFATGVPIVNPDEPYDGLVIQLSNNVFAGVYTPFNLSDYSRVDPYVLNWTGSEVVMAGGVIPIVKGKFAGFRPVYYSSGNEYVGGRSPVAISNTGQVIYTSIVSFGTNVGIGGNVSCGTRPVFQYYPGGEIYPKVIEDQIYSLIVDPGTLLPPPKEINLDAFYPDFPPGTMGTQTVNPSISAQATSVVGTNPNLEMTIAYNYYYSAGEFDTTAFSTSVYYPGVYNTGKETVYTTNYGTISGTVQTQHVDYLARPIGPTGNVDVSYPWGSYSSLVERLPGRDNAYYNKTFITFLDTNTRAVNNIPYTTTISVKELSAGEGQGLLTVRTPYETISVITINPYWSGSVWEPFIIWSIFPWIDLSNGEYLIQGYGLPKNMPDALSHAGYNPDDYNFRIFCNEENIGPILAAALKTEVNKITTIAMDIPLKYIKDNFKA